ncbi:MAG: hypothetical protein ACD_50C00115G0003 [uncultured bacterium]|nr:MAG: hypothetical protein ACD_50C00115G0003 [uncultured bacterium]OGH13164.1 MAG: hypothetical protein A2687_05255 [Candidatus Levybacteria bacterium RIFCSPHIGHO2_01_FULL_38_26]
MHHKPSRKDIHSYLTDLSLAVLATVGSDNTPYTATVFFTTDEDLNFYLMTKSSTQKFLNLEHNKNVALATIDAHTIKTVQVKGTVEKITDTDITTRIVEALAEKSVVGGISYWPPPLSKIQKGEIVVLKITPTWLRYADYSNPSEKEEEVFHQIIP